MSSTFFNFFRSFSALSSAQRIGQTTFIVYQIILVLSSSFFAFSKLFWLFTKKQDSHLTVLHVLALPIFPGRLQPSIVSRTELNFRVRDGNGWTLSLINTNLLSFEKESKQRKLYFSLSSPYKSVLSCTLKTEQRYFLKSKASLPALL